MKETYHPEPYWSKVAERISQREEGNKIAGDDEPYYRYKRAKFLKLLHSVDFEGKNVLEVGPGPGGNLVEVFKHKPKSLTGADISNDMIALAKKAVDPSVRLVKTNGEVLPFEDNTFDIIFTATVLQHNTNEAMLKKLIKEIARVSADSVVIFERIEKKLIGDELCKGRPIAYYDELFGQLGFKRQTVKFINIRMSYLVCGAIRRLLNPKSREEGQPLTKFSLALQNVTLLITKPLDNIFTSQTDVAKIKYQKVS